MRDQGNTEVDELESLLAIAREHDLDAMLVEDGDWRMELVRRGIVAPPAAVTESAAMAPPPAPLLEAALEPATPAGDVVAAPIVGVFYRSPAPSAPPFVQLGDRVAVGQPLCILEAMKLMNEITAEVAGVVGAIHANNGDLVVIGQPLFSIT